jgi:hypothetical protein
MTGFNLHLSSNMQHQKVLDLTVSVGTCHRDKTSTMTGMYFSHTQLPTRIRVPTSVMPMTGATQIPVILKTM